jgi:hypothetical protein
MIEVYRIEVSIIEVCGMQDTMIEVFRMEVSMIEVCSWRSG